MFSSGSERNNVCVTGDFVKISGYVSFARHQSANLNVSA